MVHQFSCNELLRVSSFWCQVADWSWLSDRKRQLSERAAINEQQLKASQAVAASRKRARESKKSASSSVPSPSSSSSSSSSLTVCGSIGTSRGVDDPTVAVALRKLIGIGAFVPSHCVQPITEYLRGDSAFLLANLDFEEDDCIQKLNKISTALSDSSSAQSISSDAVESWVASAQDAVVRSVMKSLVGGSRRLQKALQTLGVLSPSNLRVWRLMPDVLLEKLVAEDPNLESIMLTRLRSGGERGRGGGGGMQQQEEEGEVTGEEFSIEWVKWMCGVCEDMRDSPSAPWIDKFVCEADEEDEEADDDAGDDGGDDCDTEWVSVSDGINHVGSAVRCYSLSEDYWDEGWVTHYLPPTEEEPAALWKVRGFRSGELTASSVDRSDGKCTVWGKGRWTVDLDHDELADAIALHAAATP